MDESKHEVIEWCGGIYQKDHLWQFIKSRQTSHIFDGLYVQGILREYSCQHCRKYDIVETRVVQNMNEPFVPIMEH